MHVMNLCSLLAWRRCAKVNGTDHSFLYRQYVTHDLDSYETMDYVLCGALSHIHAAEVTVSYDVVCQYYKKIADRLARISPSSVVWAGAQAFKTFANASNISYVVPKFHLYAHKLFCQLRFAFGFLFGTGVTDGEAPERVWSNANPAAASLREMGPGNNNDTMDDIFGAWNWMKTCLIGERSTLFQKEIYRLRSRLGFVRPYGPCT